MSKQWKVQPHSGVDKSFEIQGCGYITLEVDYDDVAHPAVDALARVIARILNRYLPVETADDIAEIVLLSADDEEEAEEED